MKPWAAISRCLALGVPALLVASCAVWFVPESSSRGHVFDDAVRGVTQFDEEYARRRVDELLRRRFPVGTALDEVVGHIEDAGGICSRPERLATYAEVESTICAYASDTYFAWAYMGMGRPTYQLAKNEWTVLVGHSNGVIQEYVVKGGLDLIYLNREEYMEGLDQQRAEENATPRTSQEN